jgi:hypothetical protein
MLVFAVGLGVLLYRADLAKSWGARVDAIIRLELGRYRQVSSCIGFLPFCAKIGASISGKESVRWTTCGQ